MKFQQTNNKTSNNKNIPRCNCGMTRAYLLFDLYKTIDSSVIVLDPKNELCLKERKTK